MKDKYVILVFFSIISFALNLIIIPLLIRFANSKKLYDVPDARKIHKHPISNVGGIGIFISFFISMIIYSFLFQLDLRYIFIGGGFVIIHLLGILDDRFNIRARHKLILQIIAASVILPGGFLIRFIEIPFTGITLNLGVFSYFITIFWVISITNAINLIDGMDGQAGGISFIALGAISISHLFNGALLPAVLSLVLAMAVGAFLLFNLPPAKIFMGDGGSLLLGFAIAVLPLMESGGSVYPLAGPLTVVMIPVLDIFASIIRRRRKGIHFFTPDREHTHHKLLDFGFSNKQILSIVYSLTILFAVISIYWNMEINWIGFFMIISSWGCGVFIFLILDKKYETKIRGKRRLENFGLIS